MERYNDGQGIHNPYLDGDMQPLALSEGEIDDVVALLATLTSGFFFSSRRRHTRLVSDWSSDVCSSDLIHGGDAGIVDQVVKASIRPANLGKHGFDALFVGHVGSTMLVTLASPVDRGAAATHYPMAEPEVEIGRASCRERGGDA